VQTTISNTKKSERAKDYDYSRVQELSDANHPNVAKRAGGLAQERRGNTAMRGTGTQRMLIVRGRVLQSYEDEYCGQARLWAGSIKERKRCNEKEIPECERKGGKRYNEKEIPERERKGKETIQ